MLSKQERIIYAVVTILVLLMSFNFYSTTTNTTTTKARLTFDDTTLQNYMQTFDTNHSMNYIWGIANEKKVVPKVVENNETNETNTTKILKVEKKQNQICIEKECYRLLGIYYKKNTPFVTLFHKSFVNNIASFTTHQKVVKTLHVKRIDLSSVSFEDVNTSREWQFAFFDVNTTKYQPKDHNETNKTTK